MSIFVAIEALRLPIFEIVVVMGRLGHEQFLFSFSFIF